VDDAHLEWTLGGTAKSDKPVRIEWALGHVNAFVLYGGGYSAPPATQPTHVVPEPVREEGGATTGIAGAKQVELETRVGRLTFKVEEGNVQLTLLDGRRLGGRGWAAGEPTFWLGVTGAEVKANEPFKYRVSVTLTPNERPATVAAAEVTATAPAVVTARAFAAQPGPVRVIPTPKSIQMGDGRFVISADTKLMVVDQSAVAAARSLARDVKERFGWTWPIYASEGAHPTTHTILFTAPAVGREMHPEGYLIDSTPAGLTVMAQDNPGYFYGAQTLAQLMQVEDETVFVPACRVDDYPTLAFRGVHLFPGKNAMDLHQRLVEHVLARFKMNHLLLEADYTQWETDPKLTVDISVPKEQLGQYVQLARRSFLEPIPLVQSLGHAEWMFKNGRNRDLAEDPDEPYAYSVTNPKTYKFIESVFDETLALFGSSYFHIGHDEVAMRGRYPYRDQAKEWGESKLFIYDTNRLHDYLKNKGVGTMMWGDVLLARDESSDGAANAPSAEEAARRRAEVPKDIVICDWHYTPTDPENYRSLRVFRDAGFTTIACTWDNPENIRTFAEAAKREGAWGLLQTTWAGYTTTAKTIADQPQQFSAYVLAAEYAWNGGGPKAADLPWDAGEVFEHAMNPPKVEMGVRPGVMLNLSGVKQAEDPSENFLGMGEAMNLPKLYADQPKANHSFWSGDGAYPAVALGGAMTPGKPRTVTLKCDIPAGASEVAFLQATAFPAEKGEVVGGYEILYADGTTRPVPLRYGQDTRALTDTGPTPGAAVAWNGKTQAGVPAAIRMLRVPNPEPGKAIKGIRFSTRHPYASPILFGVTAVE
jgi:hypothetical protein